MFPKVSVVMPVYNTAQYLNESIESILNQTFGNFEFFIIDDASTDHCVEIINSYHDKRIKFIRKVVNTGYTDSLNMAIKISKGKYIARMDSDDISLPNRLQQQYDFMEMHPDVLVVGSQYKIINTEFICTPPLSFEEIKMTALLDCPVAHPTVFIRQKVFTIHNLKYNRSFEPAEDYELWTRIMEIGKIENIPEALLHYRIHEGQTTNSKNLKQIASVEKIRFRQISKLLRFNNKDYDFSFAVKILQKEDIRVCKKTLKNIIQLLTDLYKNNKTKRLYDPAIFFNYLRGIWLTYNYKYNYLNYKDTELLFLAHKYQITRMGYMFMFKKIIRMKF